MSTADPSNDPYRSTGNGADDQSDPYAARPGEPSYPPPPQSPPPYSGQPQTPPGQQPAGWPQAQPSSGLAVASLVLGIVGIVFSWFLFGIPSILAVIFGHVGVSRANKGTGGGKGMAVAGLITGYLVIGLFILGAIGLFGMAASL
jgi:hypothetical protein